MEIALSIAVGGLYACGIYLMLRRSLAQIIIGVGILTNATNLLIFTLGGLVRGRPPLVPAGASAPMEPTADPLPQALILTAIVIGFGMQAFGIVLAFRAYRAIGVLDVDSMRTTDR
jgi:multicomponent Na+:H+ antiporter subunit C